MVVQPSQTQVTPGTTNVPGNNTTSRPSEYRADGLGLTGATAPVERLLDIAVGEVRNDDRPQARARRDQAETLERPERFFQADDEQVIEALIAEDRFVPRGTFVNVVI
ncbi:MAG: hypothetical protein KI792_09810 [Alphaproteobacteria bacterium]|nr:hypothetical protein [Alphaproteobacteria bacterium SS10]